MPRLCGGTTGEQRPLSLRPGGRGLMARTDMVLAAQWGRMAGWTWTLAKLFFAFSSLLSSTGILSLYIRYNDLFAVRRTLLFSFLEGTNGE